MFLSRRGLVYWNTRSLVGICLHLVASMGLVALVCGAKVTAAEPAAAPRRVEAFSLADAGGRLHTRDEWRDKRAIVVFFLGAECPVSNGYSPAMRALSARYAKRGVACYGVHVDAMLSAADAAGHAEEYGLPFTILLDPEQTLAGMVGARVTPDAVVARPDGTVVYCGRIDDRYSIEGKRRDDPTTHELVDAIEAVLEGKMPIVRETQAYGCPLPKLRAPR
ncbi:MAG: redoxin domain-containing protein [Pirellulales bacterium]